MTLEQLQGTAGLFGVLFVIFGLIGMGATYGDLKDVSIFLAFVCLFVTVICFLGVIWGQGWLYG